MQPILPLLLLISIYIVYSCNPVCRGDTTSRCTSISNFIYIHVEANNGMVSRFYSFCVQIDQFTKLSLNQSYAFMSTNPNSFIRIHAPPFVATYQPVGKGNATETRRFFYNERTRDYLTGFYSVVLNMNRGSFANETVVYEDSCRPGTGFLPVCQLVMNRDCIRQVDCAISTSEGGDRDVKVYVAFSGTDSSMRPLQSASMIPTKFLAYSSSNMMSKLTEITRY
jgi:hypothetical protein